MGTQNIDFGTITNATFNNVGLTEIVYNGTKIWSLPAQGLDASSLKFFKKLNTLNIRVNENNNYGTQFGLSVGVSNNRIIVGSADDSAATQGGGAFLYDINGNLIKEIHPTDTVYDSWFGRRVAINDSIMVATSVGYSSDTTPSFYIYDIDGNFKRKVISHLELPNYDQFGQAIALSDSIIAIGAPGRRVNRVQNVGAVCLYDIDGNIKKTIESPNPITGSFGVSVAISNDTLIIGAYRDNSDTGAFYIYDTDGNFKKKITAHDGEAGDTFGNPLVMSDNTIMVGASADDDKAKNAGSVYIYDIEGNFKKKITAYDGEASDNLALGAGKAMAMSDKLLVIGSSMDDNENGENAGSVYIYDIEGNFKKKITAYDGAASDAFGTAIAMSSKLLVIGAYGDDDKGNHSGSVYLYNN